MLLLLRAWDRRWRLKGGGGRGPVVRGSGALEVAGNLELRGFLGVEGCEEGGRGTGVVEAVEGEGRIRYTGRSR